MSPFNPGPLAPSMLIISIVTICAPLLSEIIKRPRIPVIVWEIIFGVLIGPQVLNLVVASDPINALARVGLSLLIFLAGYEIDLKIIQGKPLILASMGWAASVGVGLIIAYIMFSVHFTLHTIIVAFAFTTTSLGTLLPILQDAKIFETKSGPYIIAAATMGEFGPIVLVTLFFSRAEPMITGLFLALFLSIAIAAAFITIKARQPKFVLFIRKHINTSDQLPVRFAALLIFFLGFLTIKLGLDILLGTFSAGVVVRLFTKGNDKVLIESKLKAIGFGFLIPLFFVVSGIHLDLRPLASIETLLRVPLFLICLLIVRGLPAFIFYRKTLTFMQQQALGLFSATGLPLIVVIATIGTSSGQMLPENAAALVGAGILSVLLFPMLGINKLQKNNSKNIKTSP